MLNKKKYHLHKNYDTLGIKAQELFIKSYNSTQKKDYLSETYLFAILNSINYSSNEDEFRKWYKIALNLFPSEGRLKIFKKDIDDLDSGVKYYERLLSYAGHKYGDCAAFAELALLHTNQLSFDQELSLRTTRALALRELDKLSENSRNIRIEEFPAEERLALIDALKELEFAIKLDPNDHKLWNFKSSWLLKMKKIDEAITAADESLKLCPSNYLKPRLNKAFCLLEQGKKEESKLEAQKALYEAEKLKEEGRIDMETAREILTALSVDKIKDEELIDFMSDRIIKSSQLTAKQEMSQWDGANDSMKLLQMLQKRVNEAGNTWSMNYVDIMKEMLAYYSSESSCVCVMRLGESNQLAQNNCIYAVLYLAACSSNILKRDACRFLIYAIINAQGLDLIKENYRKKIIGPTAVGSERFILLEQNIRNEITKCYPVLLELIANQSPLNSQELDYARNVTMSRFKNIISNSQTGTNSLIKNFINKLFK